MLGGYLNYKRKQYAVPGHKVMWEGYTRLATISQVVERTRRLSEGSKLYQKMRQRDLCANGRPQHRPEPRSGGTAQPRRVPAVARVVVPVAIRDRGGARHGRDVGLDGLGTGGLRGPTTD